MTNEEKARAKAKKLKTFLENKDLANYDEISSMAESLDELKNKTIPVSIEGAELVTIKGEKGDKGDQGEQGEQGIQGIPGDEGPQGIQGPQGLQGEQGEGTEGPPGPEGPMGPQGLQGEKGSPGQDGSSDTALDIKRKLESLKKETQLKSIKDLEYALGVLDKRTQFLINKQTGTGGGTWGSITGTLSNQTDLQAALDAKLTIPVSPADYTTTNVITDRTYNANSSTIDELADVLATLIADLTAIGLLQ